MTTGDRICPCCGSYYGCKCTPQNIWSVSYDKEIAEALERIADALEKVNKRLKKFETN